MDHVLLTNINSNPNIGLYAFANNKFCLLGTEVPKELGEEISKILKVPVHYITIAGTSLVGAFIAGNDHCILVPEITYDHELETLKKLNINFKVLKTRLTALGNNILTNNYGTLVNPEFSAEIKKEIRQALNTSLKPGKIAELEAVGSSAVQTKNGMLIHRDAEEFEIQFVEDLMKVKAERGTVNLGNPYVKSGIIVNDNGFIISDFSGGPEIVHIEQVLGFINNG